jgi:ketosteroid isomerase-like protein
MLRLWLALGCGLAVLITSGVIVSMARAQPGVDPADVITAYEMARNRQDIDAALSYFADTATVSQRNQTFSGKDEIRKYLETVASRARFTVVSDRRSTGNIVTWTERTTAQTTSPSARPQGVTLAAPSSGTQPGSASRAASNQGPSAVIAAQSGFAVTVEAVVQDGKIQSMSYIFGGPTPRSDPSLEGRAELPAGIGLAAVLAVLLGVLSIASLGLGRAAPAASSLRGRLLEDLQGWAAARQEII